MLEDMTKIKLITPRTVAEVLVAMEKHSGTRKLILQQFAQLLLGSSNLRSIMYLI